MSASRKELSIRAAAAEAGSRVALITPTERLTFSDLAAAAAALPAGEGPVEISAEPTVETLVEIIAAIEAGRPVVLQHQRLPAAQRRRQAALAAATPLPADTLAVIFTSGSTGDPRPIALGRGQAHAAIAASATHLGVRDDDAWLLCLPLAHVGGLAIVLRALAARRPIALATTNEPVAIAELATAAHATLASFVPTQLLALLDHPMPSLRAALIGGAPASRTLRTMASERGIPILTTYGMTEAWGQVVTQPADRAGQVDDGIGVPLPGVSIDAGRVESPAPIVVKGPMTRGAITTADLGYLDERGWLHVAGRIDDVIVTGGEKVHPNVVEDALAAGPGVREVCVIGVGDPRWGQRVVALVVLAPGTDLDLVIADARERLAPHQRPREWRVVANLPHTASGKVDRRTVTSA